MHKPANTGSDHVCHALRVSLWSCCPTPAPLRGSAPLPLSCYCKGNDGFVWSAILLNGPCWKWRGIRHWRESEWSHLNKGDCLPETWAIHHDNHSCDVSPTFSVNTPPKATQQAMCRAKKSQQGCYRTPKTWQRREVMKDGCNRTLQTQQGCYRTPKTWQRREVMENGCTGHCRGATEPQRHDKGQKSWKMVATGHYRHSRGAIEYQRHDKGEKRSHGRSHRRNRTMQTQQGLDTEPQRHNKGKSWKMTLLQQGKANT